MACRESAVISSAGRCFPLFSYRLWKKNLLFEWKLAGKRSLSYVFSDFAYLGLEKMYGRKNIPPVVPVPPRAGKKREKGWDQIDELCKFLHKNYGVKILPCLKRLSKNQQKKLNRESRLLTKGHSFALKNERISGKKLPREVVLIDDVMTTGVTAESCCSVLKKAGIEKVDVLALFVVD